MRSVRVIGRTLSVIAAVCLVGAGLAGCSSDPTENCSGALPTGSESGMVKAQGPLGSNISVSVPAPVLSSTSQRTVLKLGNGARVHKGTSVELTYTAINGGTGKVAGRSASRQWLPITSDTVSKALECVPAGSRVAVVLSPHDAGLQVAVSAIYVIDVLHVYPSRADGSVRPSRSGFPTVVLAPNGQPGVSINPSDPAPTSVRSEVLKAGSGATVTATSEVVVQYTAVDWEQKTVTTSTWSTGSPDLVDMASGQSQLQSQQNSSLSTDMLRELIGHRVGSQLLIETPETSTSGAAAWVVDVVGVR